MNENNISQTEEPIPGQDAAIPENQDPPAGETPARQSPEEQIQTLEAKLQEANDQYLRKAADFENFRKRMVREKQEAIDFANQGLLLDLIPVIDDFERAIKSAGNIAESAGSPAPEFKNLYDGIVMIEKRLLSQLENKWGLKRFDSAGDAFDPNRHEAIMMEKSPETAEPLVQEDFIKGYLLKDRVVRSAKVKVLMPETPPGEAADEDGPGEEAEGV
ncbi:MAG: nucleotide exchange factor GrpE [Treponema sp.]|jgi:molecular chaperone GrpE|nr:nucleotide exchange factor GrpE [Treponema sp.]